MDRISDSGSDDWGSTPHGRTKKRTAVIAARFFVAEKSRRSATITSFHNIIAKTKRAEIENEMSKTSLFSLPFFSCIYWNLNNN